MPSNVTWLSRRQVWYASKVTATYRRALDIDEKALGPDYPEVDKRLNNLAEFLRAEGDYGGAEPLYRRALAIAEIALGPNHPGTRTIRQNLEQLMREKAARQ